MTPDPEPGNPDPPASPGPYTIDISRNQNGGAGFTKSQFEAFKTKGVGAVIAKLLGANNPDYPLYTELVHQDNARAAGMVLGHYIANGQVGAPAQIAKATLATGQVRPGEVLWQDVEDWPEDDVRRWTPAECESIALAFRDAGKPLGEQGIYLNLSLANNGGYREMMDRLGLNLWLAAYTEASDVLLEGGWDRKPMMWQFTSDNIPALRGIYNANLDVNVTGANVWLVYELQEALNKANGANLVVDNSNGRKTSAEILSFQKAVFSDSREWDGIAGGKTLGKLRAQIGK